MIENININPRTEELKTEFSNMIWKMATNLVHGGKVNPVQFMDYTLGGLFYRFISENITDYCNQLMRDAGVENADYAHMSDEMAENAREQIINAKGFFILPSQLFINVANAAKNNTELNTTLSNNFRAIENSAVGKPSENDVKGLFNNFNTNDQGLVLPLPSATSCLQRSWRASETSTSTSISRAASTCSVFATSTSSRCTPSIRAPRVASSIPLAM